MAWDFEMLVDGYGGVSEGPTWDGSGLLYSEIDNCRIMRWDPVTRASQVFREHTDYANGLTFDAGGRLYGCEGGGRRVVRYEEGGGVTVLASSYDGKKLNLPNDLAIDEAGDIWFSDPWYEGSAGEWSQTRRFMELDHESVYCLTAAEESNWEIRRVTFDTTRPNGVLFSLDCRTLYVAQSGRRSDEKRELRGYPVREDGTLGEPDVLHDFGPHRGVDGMCLDLEGNIIAAAGSTDSGPGPMIYVFWPSGRILETHPVPCYKPTNCSFGGADLSTLYVTTVEGHLLCARTERQGRLHYPPLN